MKKTSQIKLVDDTFMTMVKNYEKESKCVAKKVACILTLGNTLISVGANGTLSGSTNCNDIFRKDKDKWLKKDDKGVFHEIPKEEIENNGKESHHHWSLVNEIHAEMNAIYKAQEKGRCVKGCTAYVSYCPCVNCSKMLALWGIKRIVYREDYDHSEDVIEFLKSHGIEVEKYDDTSNKSCLDVVVKRNVMPGEKNVNGYTYDVDSYHTALKKYLDVNPIVPCYLVQRDFTGVEVEKIKIGTLTDINDGFCTLHLDYTPFSNILASILLSEDQGGLKVGMCYLTDDIKGKCANVLKIRYFELLTQEIVKIN